MRSPRCTARAGAALACSTLVLTTVAALPAVAAAADQPAVAQPPVAASPAAEVPAVEVPAVEVPAVEVPAVEVPSAVAPLPIAVEAPRPRRTVPAPLPNRAPVATDDRVLVVQGGSATIDLFANDSDPDGDALSLVGGTSAGHGTVSFTDGVATYAADAEFAGDDAFVYIVGDGRGSTASGTVHITVMPAQSTTVAPPARGASDPRPAPAAAVPVPAPVPVEPVRVTAPAATPPVAAQGAPTEAQQVVPVRSTPRRATATTAAAMGPSTTPYVPPAARPATLPFTGSAADVLLPFGVALLLAGGLLAACARPRLVVPR